MHLDIAPMPDPFSSSPGWVIALIIAVVAVAVVVTVWAVLRQRRR